MRRFLIVAAVAIALTGMLAYLLLAPIPIEERWFAVAWLAWAPIGALILWRRPGNGVALTQLWIGLSWGIGFWTTVFSATNAPLQLRVWSDLVGVILGVLPWFGIVWLMLIFPTGRLESRLERVTAGLLFLVATMAIFSFVVTTASMEGPTGLPSPLASPSLDRVISWLVDESGFWLVVLLVSLAIFALARRWVKSRGVVRHQYRWLLLGGMVFVVVLAIGQLAPEGDDGILLWLLAGSAIPAVTGVAVSRYRLYEIDRIISRTLSYAIVVGLLAAVFATGVVWIPSALDLGDSPLLVAASTLVVAALFNPVRKRVHGWVDRRFNRSHFDAERVMDGFAGSLRHEVDPDWVVQGWVGVVEETMQPSLVGVWVRDR